MKFAFTAVLFFVILNPASNVSAITPLTGAAVWERVNSDNPPLIIDVRSNEQYVEGHIPTSINFPIQNGVTQNVANKILSYNKTEVITVCSCLAGGSARLFAENLSNFGNFGLFYMRDNFLDWPFDIVTGNDPGIIHNDPSKQNKNQTTDFGETFQFLILNVIIFSIIGYLFLIKPKLKK